ncbi:enoyl-CoA hydratase [Nocardioides sp. AE5]|uniref:enoyl-CoA hydratase n=1 Tax=Nocardioides sp. AE5 TaxID=2962573 RepID=UPI00288159F5|nr:enoyl-CoA hydratase [Nocardioides sp. AE5]MDT0200677.1 enoyl-CoA hydratase [Nocardioides sp. AE5]
MNTGIRLERPRPGVARVVLARSERRNAQNPALLKALDAAFLEAVADEAVKVIILAAEGPDFSSGHDLKGSFDLDGDPIATMHTRSDQGGIEGHFNFECEFYLGLCLRWRDIPKPTVAQVQGRVIAGGLMLVWPMDLVVAGENASFSDPVTAFGVNGVEYFTHLYEVGIRKAREMLYTGDAVDAAEAHRLGMVNHVVPEDQLEDFTLDLAERIAARPQFGLRLSKLSINQQLDAMGQRQSLESALAVHNLGHANNLVKHGTFVDPDGADMIRAAARRPGPGAG